MMRRMTRDSTCVHLPLPNTFFAKYTLGRQITNLSSLSKFIHKKSSCFSETCERPHMGEEKVEGEEGQ